MVAEALRSDRHRTERSEDGSREGSDSSGRTTTESAKSDEARQWEYAAMTLPCVAFPSRIKHGSSHHPNPLFMTIALMTDEDPLKRCFHCTLTDNPGTTGDTGFVTPEFLALLFSSADVREACSADETNAESCSSDGDNIENNKLKESYMYNEEDDDDDEMAEAIQAAEI